MKKTLIAVLFLGIFAQANMVESKLRYVIDGDTAKFANGTCRFAYIDTPESKMNAKLVRDIKKSSVSSGEVIRAGRIASGYVKSLLRKGDIYTLKITGTDRWNRNICIIYDKDGTSINDKIVSAGMAVPFWRYIPSLKKQDMIKRVKSAKANNKGLWRAYPNVMEMMN